MKPRFVQAGTSVVLKCSDGVARVGVIVCRDVVGGRATTAVRVPDFAGLNGSDDVGIVHLSDYDVSRKLQRAGAQ